MPAQPKNRTPHLRPPARLRQTLDSDQDLLRKMSIEIPIFVHCIGLVKRDQHQITRIHSKQTSHQGRSQKLLLQRGSPFLCALHWSGEKGPTPDHPDPLKANFTPRQIAKASATKRKPLFMNRRPNAEQKKCCMCVC